MTFDLFGNLAEHGGRAPDAKVLRQASRAGSDSHPTELAGQTGSPLTADFILMRASACDDA